MVTTRYKVAKYLLFCVLAVLLFVLQVTPGLFAIRGVRPMPLIGFAVAIAFYEGELVGGIFGAVCGFLCDFYGYDFKGYYALMLFLCCVAVGVLARTYVTTSLLNSVIASFASILLIQTVSWFFQLVFWNYAGAGVFYLSHVLPLSLYTAVFSALMFWLVRWVWTHFQKKIDAKTE